MQNSGVLGSEARSGDDGLHSSATMCPLDCICGAWSGAYTLMVARPCEAHACQHLSQGRRRAQLGAAGWQLCLPRSALVSASAHAAGTVGEGDGANSPSWTSVPWSGSDRISRAAQAHVLQGLEAKVSGLADVSTHCQALTGVSDRVSMCRAGARAAGAGCGGGAAAGGGAQREGRRGRRCARRRAQRRAAGRGAWSAQALNPVLLARRVSPSKDFRMLHDSCRYMLP